MSMRNALLAAGAVAAALGSSSAQAQGTVKIGVILPYSGQFADTGNQLDNGIKLYIKQNGDTVAGKKVEVIRKDVGGIAPDVAKRLAQELVVRDKVDILAGFALTPNALAAADVSAEAKKFMVDMLAATSIITTKSPYMARVSFTTPQLNDTLGAWAYRGGLRKIYSMVADFGPGHDAEAAFQQGFKAAGGEIIGSVRIPGRQSGFLGLCAARQGREARRASTSGSRAARCPARSARRSPQRGIDATKTTVLGQDVLTDEHALRSMGDVGARHRHRRCLRLQSQDQAQPRFRQGLQRGVQAQPGCVLDRRL